MGDTWTSNMQHFLPIADPTADINVSASFVGGHIYKTLGGIVRDRNANKASAVAGTVSRTWRVSSTRAAIACATVLLCLALVPQALALDKNVAFKERLGDNPLAARPVWVRFPRAVEGSRVHVVVPSRMHGSIHSRALELARRSDIILLAGSYKSFLLGWLSWSRQSSALSIWPTVTLF